MEEKNNGSVADKISANMSLKKETNSNLFHQHNSFRLPLQHRLILPTVMVMLLNVP